jgi:CBS domain-containing protein
VKPAPDVVLVHPTPDVDRLLSRLRDIPGVVVLNDTSVLASLSERDIARILVAERHERIADALLAQIAARVPTLDDARPMNRAQRRKKNNSNKRTKR